MQIHSQLCLFLTFHEFYYLVWFLIGFLCRASTNFFCKYMNTNFVICLLFLLHRLCMPRQIWRLGLMESLLLLLRRAWKGTSRLQKTENLGCYCSNLLHLHVCWGFFLPYVEFQIVKFSIDSCYLDKKFANRFWGMFCLSHGSCRFTTAQKLDKLGMRGSDT